MHARLSVRPFSVVETSYIGLYPFVRDDRERNDRAVIPLIEAAGTARQLLAAVPWIVPGGVSDAEACLQLLRLRDELTPEEWRSVLDPRRPTSRFTRLAQRLRWRVTEEACRQGVG
jgi:hypothetical protein